MRRTLKDKQSGGKLLALPKINLVATWGKDDVKALRDALTFRHWQSCILINQFGTRKYERGDVEF